MTPITCPEVKPPGVEAGEEAEEGEEVKPRRPNKKSRPETILFINGQNLNST